MELSIVIPVYQSAQTLHALLERVSKACAVVSNSYQIILVDDGSTDESWSIIENLATDNNKITGLKLSRNFGQHHAITAGLDFCCGNWVVVMDCDLQDVPEEIPALYNKTLEGYDIVLARRMQRTDSFFKRKFSKLFFAVFGYFTGIKYDASIANFGVYNKKVINAIKKMKEPMRAFFPMVQWVGFSKTAVEVAHGSRYAGKSTYNFGKLFKLAFDILLSYSDKPLRIIVKLGFIIAAFSFTAALVTLFRYFNNEITVSGYTSIIISLWFLGGLLIFTLGIIGLYISRIFTGIKNRPLYIVDKSVNIHLDE